MSNKLSILDANRKNYSLIKKQIIMLKNILGTTGVQKLEKSQQQKIQGGKQKCIHPKTGECTDFGIKCYEVECALAI